MGVAGYVFLSGFLPHIESSTTINTRNCSSFYPAFQKTSAFLKWLSKTGDLLMSFLPFSHILRLRRELDSTDAEISTWGCDKYEGYIKQWSDSCDTLVVSHVNWCILLAIAENF